MGNNITNETLLKRTSIFLKDKEWEKAAEYANRILDSDPNCSEAYLFLVIAKYNKSSITELVNSNDDFWDDNNFKRALEFASEENKKEILSYKNASIYNRIKLLSNNSKDIDSMNKIIEYCSLIPGYKDVENIRAENLINVEIAKKRLIYEDAIRKMNSKTINGLIEAEKLFNSISGFEDSKEKELECGALKKSMVIEKNKKSKKRNFILISILIIIMSFAIVFVTKKNKENALIAEKLSHTLIGTKWTSTKTKTELPSDYNYEDRIYYKKIENYNVRFDADGLCYVLYNYEEIVLAYPKYLTFEPSDFKYDHDYNYSYEVVVKLSGETVIKIGGTEYAVDINSDGNITKIYAFNGLER